VDFDLLDQNESETQGMELGQKKNVADVKKIYWMTCRVLPTPWNRWMCAICYPVLIYFLLKVF